MKNVTYISAGAGSGKTYTLTERLTDLIKDGKVKPEQVILTTFTKKAAAEFKEKVKSRLYAEGLFDDALRLDQAMIGTVHSVCDQMVNKYWFELGLAPGMGVMPDEDADNEKDFYISQSLSDLPTDKELEFLHEYCRQFDIQKVENFIPKGPDYNFWKHDLEQIISYSTNYEIENYEHSIEKSLDFFRQFVDESVILPNLEERKSALEEHLAFLSSQKPTEKNDKRIENLKRLKRELQNPPICWYADFANIVDELKKRGPLADAFARSASNVWHSPEVYKLQERYIRLLFLLADRWNKRYEQFKREKSLIDYNDMEKYMLQLLNIPGIAKDISDEFRYLFVDEFQDSSPMQVKIFDKLSDLMEHSYWVGDYKQSIYGFRGSDIALVKSVVDRIAEKEAGCETETLDTSYRSLPPIVDFCNTIFTKTFDGILDKKNVVLKTHRKPMRQKSLCYFRAGANKDSAEAVADYVASLIEKGVKPNEIGVLAYGNSTLAEVAASLSEMNIPCSREELPIIDSKSYLLASSLLRLVRSDRDNLAKATVANLTVQGFNTKVLIEQKLEFDDNVANRKQDFLNEVPLIAKLNAIKSTLRQKSISAMVESVVVELNLMDEAKAFEDAATAKSCLQTLINAARVYEDRCVQMNIPSTVDGFISFVESVNPAGNGNPEGVQLHTYHKSKGLQWPHVIMMSLNDNIEREDYIVAKEVFGVHAGRYEAPSAENPYPEMFIRLLHWPFGNSKNAPGDIREAILRSDDFKTMRSNKIEECNRLLYVGATRAADALHLCVVDPKNDNSLLCRFRSAGFPEIGNSVPEGPWDPFGTGHIFSDRTPAPRADGGDPSTISITDDTLAAIQPRKLKLEDASYRQGNPRYVSPSSIHTKGNVDNHYDFNERIPLTGKGVEMTTVGNCIHQIFAEMDSPHVEIADTIRDYGLANNLKDIPAIEKAWENLCNWLTERYGEAIKVYHERPFRLEKNGQTFVGSIDLVWRTAGGDVLVDFKTAPVMKALLLDAESDHYAGWYAGQLDAYQDALEAAGEKVIGRHIYFPVAGMIAEIGKTLPLDIRDIKIMIMGIGHVDLPRLLRETVSKSFKDQNLSRYLVLNSVVDDEDFKEYETALHGPSSQGLHVSILETHDRPVSCKITIPTFASEADILYANVVTLELVEKFPECSVSVFDSDKTLKQATGLADFFGKCLQYVRQSVKRLIESCERGTHTVIGGINHRFALPTPYDYPDMNIDDLTAMAMDDFRRVQWQYEGVASARDVDFVEGDKKYSSQLLDNDGDLFVGPSQKLSLMNAAGDLKTVWRDDFVEEVEGTVYFEKVDPIQFVIREMHEEEWEDLWNNLDGLVIEASCRKPKPTYIMRWNAEISSMTEEGYRTHIGAWGEGFTDWSIWEWEDAHEGDQFFMVREDGPNAGIVFLGELVSNPYEGDDWAGKEGKKRYYVDLHCRDAVSPDVAPLLTIAELEAAIPDFNWRRGHSGELLTDDQAEALINLFTQKHPDK